MMNVKKLCFFNLNVTVYVSYVFYLFLMHIFFSCYAYNFICLGTYRDTQARWSMEIVLKTLTSWKYTKIIMNEFHKYIEDIKHAR
jgi:hypothetical protein